MNSVTHTLPTTQALSIGDRLSDFFDNGLQVGSVRVMPMDALIGGFYIGYVAYNIKKFVDSFCDNHTNVTSAIREVKSLRDRLVERLIYTVQAVSSSMLFVDWGIDKGWFSVTCVARSVFKATAHSMSVVFWGYKSLLNIKNLVALPSLIEKAEKARMYSRADLEPEIYKEWTSLFSNFAFVLASSLQVMSLATGAVVPLATISLLVTSSVVLMIAGFAIDLLFDSSSKVDAVRLTFANVQSHSGYTMLK